MAALPTQTGDWLSPSEAARRLGLSVIRVRELLNEGRIEHQWTPLGRLVSAAAVAELAEQRRQQAQARATA